MVLKAIKCWFWCVKREHCGSHFILNTVHISNISKQNIMSELCLVADDTALISFGCTWVDVYNQASSVLVKVKVCFDHNILTTIEKTKCLLLFTSDASKRIMNNNEDILLKNAYLYIIKLWRPSLKFPLLVTSSQPLGHTGHFLTSTLTCLNLLFYCVSIMSVMNPCYYSTVFGCSYSTKRVIN